MQITPVTDNLSARLVGALSAAVLLLGSVGPARAAEAHRAYQDLRGWIEDNRGAEPAFSPGEKVGIQDRWRLEPFIPISAWEEYFFEGMEMEVAAATSYPLPSKWGEEKDPDYRLDEEGVLVGFTGGGFPFAEIDPADRQAAQKVIWNMVWRPGAEGQVMPMTAWSRGPNGRLDREIEFTLVDARYAQGQKPLVEGDEDDIQAKQLMEFRSPRDFAGTKTLTKKYVDHHKEDGGWMYSPQQRKPRRVLASERTSEMLGMDWTREDMMGFGGKVYEHRWTYLGKKRVLATINVRDNPEMGGAHSWVPNRARWDLRTAHVLLIEPKDPKHPYGHKILFIDDEHFWTLWMFTFDRQDESLFRLSQHFLKYSESYGVEPPRQPPFMKLDYASNLGEQVFLHLGETDINVRKPHATVTHCYAKRTAFSPGRAKQFFSLRNMVSGRR
ncbi:MAG: DUF1329 domain-containing protein [Deltaproteobacteria bacterium]|nr:DUF1329 domain-containing protein [Deltaproteobacteria bacterium]